MKIFRRIFGYRSQCIGRLLPVLALVLLWPGCAHRPAEEIALQHEETYYFNAELAFSIEYPSDWELAQGGGSGPEGCTVRWHSASAPGASARVTAAAMACPLALWPGGFEEMITHFKAGHPAMDIHEEKAVDLPGGEGLMVRGHEESEENLSVFLRSKSRGYVLTFSAPGTGFDAWRPLFEEMLESFRMLEEPLSSSPPEHPD